MHSLRNMEMSEFNNVATRILIDHMEVKKGELVIILGEKINLEFCQALVSKCYEIGAVPTISILSNKSGIYRSKKISRCKKIHKHLLASIKRNNVVVWVSPHEDFNIIEGGGKELLGAIEERRFLFLGYPSKEQVLKEGMEYDEYYNIFWDAIQVDWSEMKIISDNIRKVLQNCREIHITSEYGTDLAFDIIGRKVFSFYGVVNKSAIAEGKIQLQLPAGEVYVAPLENSADGIAVFDVPTVWNNQPIERLVLTFKDGKVVKHSAKKGDEAIGRAIDEIIGLDTIAEFGMGLNPMIKPTGSITLDEKALGTIHLAIGENKHLGGENTSNIHIDFVMSKPTVYADGKMILDNRKWFF